MKPADRSLVQEYWNYKMWDATFPAREITEIFQEYQDILYENEVRERTVFYSARKGPREKALFQKMNELLGPPGVLYHPRSNMVLREVEE